MRLCTAAAAPHPIWRTEKEKKGRKVRYEGDATASSWARASCDQVLGVEWFTDVPFVVALLCKS